jgi:HSP20 family protein
MNIKDLMQFGKKNVPLKHEEDNPYTVLRRDIDSLFDNFFRGFDTEFFGSGTGVFTPKVDIREYDKDIRISIELPGMDETDINVSLTRDLLTIKGDKKEEQEDKGKDYYRLERSYGSFSRTIPLPVEVESDKIDAYFKKGVLTITLPKSVKSVSETKRIAVRVGQ